MTKEQYEKYTTINEELKPLKSFLMWCGKRYKDNSVSKYPFKIDKKTKKFTLRRIGFSNSISNNTYEISVELQNRIIETIENYVVEKEKELQDI